MAETVGFASAGVATEAASALGQALEALDDLLDQAFAAAAEAYGSDAASDPYRGLYLAPRDIARLRARAPLAPIGDGDGAPPRLAATLPRLARIAEEFGLGAVDLDVLVIAAAPDLDLRYERMYAYLQDDVTRRRPTVDLVLDLLSTSADEKLALRTRLEQDGALVRNGLIRLVPDPNHVEPSALSHYVVPDALVLSQLLGRDGLDPRLLPFCRLDAPSDRDAPIESALVEAVRDARARREPFVLHLAGVSGAGQDELARSLAAALGTPLLTADLGELPAGDGLLRIAFREARVARALLYCTGVDRLREEDRSDVFDDLLAELDRSVGPVVVAGAHPWPAERGPSKVATITCRPPGLAGRVDAWEAALERADIRLPRTEIDELAARFRLNVRQIHYAAARAAVVARTEARTASSEDLFVAARTQSSRELSPLARKVQSPYRWSDLVLPADCLELLREICAQVRNRALVYEQWGFEKRLSLGRGLTVLFAGPSGTGKTMAAEVMSNELGLELYKIDLSGVVSKYIGETEKNLARIFDAAETANAILFFDEADALFGKRTVVRDSHDRYANVETSYLLQRIEEYDGVAILASNLRKNLDEAFARRLHFAVEFPFPDSDARLRIWRSILPAETPRSAELPLERIASEFDLSGGSIRNAALAAASLAATDGSVVSAHHLLHAVMREMQKMGRVFTTQELPDGAAERRGQG